MIISPSFFSQEANKKFVLNLVEENIMEIQDQNTNQKNYDIQLTLDTIQSSSYYLNENFKILKFNLVKNKVSYDSNKLSVFFNSSYCNTYILAIDSENNSYKLQGFQKNDILFLIYKIKEKLHYKSSKEVLKFLKENVEDIDFECMYKSLIEEKLSSKCIIPCSEGIRSH